jgi:glucokinase
VPSRFELTALSKYRLRNFLDTQETRMIWESLVSLMEAFVRDVADLVKPDDPIVISFPGPISKDGQPIAAPMIVGDRSTPPDIREHLSRSTGRPVFLLNDLSAAAWYLSVISNVERFLVVTVSSGIGSKLCDRLSSDRVMDDVPYAGEIGHITVDDSFRAPPCDCGGRGHLGAIASGRGIERAAQRKAARDHTAFSHSLCVSQFGATPSSLSNEHHIVPAALASDPWTLDVVKDCTKPLGGILATLTVAAGLQHIFVIGGFAQTLGTVYLECLRGFLMAHNSFSAFPFASPALLSICTTNEETCLLGTAAYTGIRLDCS